MTYELKDKVVLITGGSRGIGRSLVASFAQAGAKVAFSYLSSAEAAQQLEAEIKAEGGISKGFRSNAASFEEAEQLVKNTIAHFEGLHILVNNAGMNRDKLLMSLTQDDWKEVIDANLNACFYTAKHATTHLIRQRQGVIINIGSVVGITGNPGQTNYASAKAGLIGLTKSIAIELGARNIRCNLIAPGFIQTDMTDKLNENLRKTLLERIPLRYFGQPQDIANLCLFLASDNAKYITGQIIRIDGGMRL